MSTKLYVGNLPYSTTEQDLRDAFGRFGEIVSADIIVERDTGRSKGFGFVEMSSAGEAAEAMQAMNGSQLGDRTIKVNEARPKRERRTPQNYDRNDDW